MKFFTVAAVSFSLGCQVLAAPIDTPALPAVGGPVAPIAAEAEAVPGVSSLTTRDYSTTSSYSYGPPGPPATVDFTTITTSLASLKSSVSPELSAIMTMSASNITTYAVPQIKNHLENICTKMNSTITTLGPALVGSVLLLTAEEAEALLAALADLESLVFSIKSTLSSTLSIVKADIVALVQPEIAAVFGLVFPLLSPVTAFVYSIAHLVPGGEQGYTKLTSAAGSVMAVAAPMAGSIKGLAIVPM